MIRIGAYGYGLAAILGAGAVLLAAMGNTNWNSFLGIAAVLFIISVVLRRI